MVYIKTKEKTVKIFRGKNKKELYKNVISEGWLDKPPEMSDGMRDSMRKMNKEKR